MFKPTICLDFDGVLHWYRPEYCQAEYHDEVIQDEPVPGAREAVERLREKYSVVVYSSRCRSAIGRMAIHDWLRKNRIYVDEVVSSKVPALVYIDDRGIGFHGDWEQTLKDIDSFRNWLRGSGWSKEPPGGKGSDSGTATTASL